MVDSIHYKGKENLSYLNDTVFSRSATSLTITTINNTTLPTYANARPSTPLSKDALRDDRKLSVDCQQAVDHDLLSTPVLNNYSTFDNQNILSDMETSPTFALFDTHSPVTPQTPHFAEFSSEINKIHHDTEDLDRFTLSPDLFDLTIDDRIGKGGNSYVYSSQLSTMGQLNNSFNVAVKIPLAKNKRSYILKEAKFAIKLREYQDVWFNEESRVFPFIECYGLYYLNKQKFPLFTSYENYPCLVMKKMNMGLPEYITSSVTKPNTPKINIGLWWKLCQTLLDSLSILKRLNYVHCDLKTDNIMVYEYNSDNYNAIENILFKVIDFSSASNLDEMTTSPDMTLQFTAPELLDFKNRSLPSFETDLYSAGLILLEALTGNAPYSSAGYDHFYLLSVIQEGKVFDWITPEDKVLLQTYPEIHRVLDMMIHQRRDVDSIAEYVRTL